MNTYYIAGYPISDELYHHGIKGQRWGVRRYQNEDGTLTAAGKARYGSVENYNNAQNYKNARRAYNKAFSNAYSKRLRAYAPLKRDREANTKRWEDVYDKANDLNQAKKAYKESDKKESISRGQKLIAMGRSKGGTIGRGIGRQIGIYAAKNLAGAAVGAVIVAAMFNGRIDLSDPNTLNSITKGSEVVGKLLSTAAIGATAYNVSKTVKQYNDIKRAEDAR